jgi:hypothetical protein
VLVFWHQLENKRDFFPRIGAEILNIETSNFKALVSLADNSLKLVKCDNFLIEK